VPNGWLKPRPSMLATVAQAIDYINERRAKS
jgi:hypothetical protein